jgi:hypothetical protein
VQIPVGREQLDGDLVLPQAAQGLVTFAHDSGSIRRSVLGESISSGSETVPISIPSAIGAAHAAAGLMAPAISRGSVDTLVSCGDVDPRVGATARHRHPHPV